MNIVNLFEVTPAPWIARRSESHPGKWIVADANDEYVATFEIEEAAVLTARSFNAFAVMMRRGWSAEPYHTSGPFIEWLVRDVSQVSVEEDGYIKQDGKLFSGPDPFTALVEADKYMKTLEVKRGD